MKRLLKSLFKIAFVLSLLFLGGTFLLAQTRLHDDQALQTPVAYFQDVKAVMQQNNREFQKFVDETQSPTPQSLRPPGGPPALTESQSSVQAALINSIRQYSSRFLGYDVYATLESYVSKMASVEDDSRKPAVESH